MQKKSGLIVFAFLLFVHLTFSQNTDTKKVSHFGTAVTVTNKGISFIPNLALGKPAVIFDFSVGSERFSFDPQFRFALEGKPWSFLFWLRYKIAESHKFQFSVGGHPALSFRERLITKDGISSKDMVVRRYLAGELYPSYSFSKNITAGIYYLYSRGIESDIPQNTNFINLRATFSNIKLNELYFMRFSPQFYYLKMDKKDGFYYNATLALARKNCPFSLSGLVNKAFKTNVTANNKLLWNVSLIYAFNKKYVEQ